MVTFDVNGNSYGGTADSKPFLVPGGMPVKNLKVVFPEHFVRIPSQSAR